MLQHTLNIVIMDIMEYHAKINIDEAQKWQWYS